MPQVEQFGMTLHERGSALVGAVSDERATASVCVYRIGRVGVVTSHRILMRQDMPFSECSGAKGLCIATLSSDSLALCPVARPARSRESGNVAVFGQTSYECTMMLRAGSVQDAVSVTLLSDWFDRLEGADRLAARELIDGVAETCPDEVSRTLDARMRSISPLFGGRLADERSLVAQVAGVARATLTWHEERERAEAAEGTLAQARLVRSAQRLIASRLSEPLSLDALAHDLLTSRSRLCAAFRQQVGESLGAYIKRLRMERAAALLEVSSLSVAEVARAVGYPRASSFTVTFEGAFGCSPSAWRAAHA